MLPTQILLNNFLYDLAQVTIPTDNVDDEYVSRPERWDIHIIRDFMIYIGPISSVFDIITFIAMLRVFHATETLFHTGWFVESIATQTLVLFVIRTFGNPFRSRPSRPLALTTIGIVALALVLPVTPLAPFLGFTVPPLRYFALLVVLVVVYLVAVEIAKERLVKRLAR
jgi:Mg2+-importing ATPase